MNNVITNFGRYGDADLDEASLTIVKDCTANANFVFTGAALTNLTAAQIDFHTKLSATALGGPIAVTAKNVSRDTLVNDLRILCTQVNLLANGDLGKLQSSGAPLAKTKQHHDMPLPTGLLVTQTNVSGSVNISVDKPAVADHGTMFAYTPTANASVNLNDWKMLHANGHTITIMGLTVGQSYQFSAAYKGKDDDALVWAAAIAKMVV